MRCETIREFKTKHFRVIVEAQPEYDLDLSFDETGETAKKIDSGEYVAFCACARVEFLPTGQTIATDYLGNCIYKSLDDFMDHRECGKLNRKWAKQGKQGHCGSYFHQMISTVCEEARKTFNDNLNSMAMVRVRTVS